MTPKGRLAVAAAEQAGRVLGSRAAYSALRSLAITLNDPSDRLAALLHAGRHAAGLGDEAALLGLATLLGELPPVALEPPRGLTELCAELLGSHRPRVAAELARAEVQRAPRAEAYYLLGRCLHGHAAAEADEAYSEVERLLTGPSAPGTRSPRRAARHLRRTLALAQRIPVPVAATEADAAAAQGDSSEASLEPLHALSDAAARLERGGRYARAMAIDRLAELSHDATLSAHARHTALRLLARYADEHGDSLSEVEAERLDVALAAHDPSLSAALARRRSWNAARPPDALARDTPPTPAQRIASLLEREALEDAVRALREARTASAVTDAGGSLYAAGWLALRSPDGEVSREGAQLLEALLRHSTRAPHGGFLRLAASLEGDHPVLSGLALSRAAARAEPNAVEALGAALVDEAWRAYALGDRAAALSALRRADRLAAEPAVARPPDQHTASPAGPGVANRTGPSVASRDDRRPPR